MEKEGGGKVNGKGREGKGGSKLNLCTKRSVGKMLECNPADEFGHNHKHVENWETLRILCRKYLYHFASFWTLRSLDGVHSNHLSLIVYQPICLSICL